MKSEIDTVETVKLRAGPREGHALCGQLASVDEPLARLRKIVLKHG